MNESQINPSSFHPNVKNISGQRFGQWTVLSRAAQNGKGRNARWLCRCDCGNEVEVLGNQLRRNKSTGCRKCVGDKIAEAKTIHGDCGSRTYSCWSNMRSRASSNEILELSRYAKRDITICDRWSSYQNFVEDMGHCPSDKHSIDRENNDLGYYKENCRWATQKQQQRNKSSNRIIEYLGRKMCAAEFSEITGIKYWLVTHRARLGWSAERIIQTPSGKARAPR